MKARLPLLAVLLAALILPLIAGCGGTSRGTGSNSAPSANGWTADSAATGTTVAPIPKASGKSLSGSVLVAHADAICERRNAELDARNNDVINNQQAVVHAASRRAEIEQSALTELRGLTPPASLARSYQELLSARLTVLEDIKKIGDDAAAKDIAAETPIYASSVIVVRKVAAIAERIGLGSCAQLG